MSTVTGVAGLMTPWAEVVRTAGWLLGLVAGAEEGAEEWELALNEPLCAAGEFFPGPFELLVQAASNATAAPPAATTAHPDRRNFRRSPVPTCI